MRWNISPLWANASTSPTYNRLHLFCSLVYYIITITIASVGKRQKTRSSPVYKTNSKDINCKLLSSVLACFVWFNCRLFSPPWVKTKEMNYVCLAFTGRGPVQVTGNESDIQPEPSQLSRWIGNILPTPPAVTARRLLAERQHHQQQQESIKEWPSFLDKVDLMIRNKQHSSWNQMYTSVSLHFLSFDQILDWGNELRTRIQSLSLNLSQCLYKPQRDNTVATLINMLYNDHFLIIF